MAESKIRRLLPEVEYASSNYQLFMGLLSLLSLFNLAAWLVLHRLGPHFRHLDGILDTMNLILSMIFLMDFAARLITSRDRRGYFFRRYGWADLLASLPLHQAKIVRWFRLVRVIRLIREYGWRRLAAMALDDRAEASLFVMLFLGLLVLQFGSLAILDVEENVPGANITNSSDALWYVIETISTVGYGDKYPVSNIGRVVGSFIILVGVGIFGTFTGYVANFFLSPAMGRRGKDSAADSDSDSDSDASGEVGPDPGPDDPAGKPEAQFATGKPTASGSPDGVQRPPSPA